MKIVVDVLVTSKVLRKITIFEIQLKKSSKTLAEATGPSLNVFRRYYWMQWLLWSVFGGVVFPR